MVEYWVITPEYGVINPVLDFGIGPEEPTRDVVEVEAPNKRQAKVQGLKLLRQIHDGWINGYRDARSNPFTGLLVVEKERFA